MQQMSINCKGRLIDLSTPVVMGILNITPDSFYDGGTNVEYDLMIEKVNQMLLHGAAIIDVGGYSSKPGADFVSEEVELQRILPVVKLLVEKFPEIILSIDTFRSKVAEACLKEGAAIINDISGGDLDAEMFSVVAKYQVPYIAMHMQGNPQTMQLNPVYDDVVKEVFKNLSEKIFKLNALQVHDVIIDLGFGFGKTIQHNYQLLNNLAYFKNLNVPILTGVSRKSMLYKTLNITPQEALNATTVANTIALLNGTNILRVHDVKEAAECVKIVKALCN